MLAKFAQGKLPPANRHTTRYSVWSVDIDRLMHTAVGCQDKHPATSRLIAAGPCREITARWAAGDASTACWIQAWASWASNCSSRALCQHCGATSLCSWHRTRLDRPLSSRRHRPYSVQMNLRVRKFICTTSDCPRRILTERLPAALAPCKLKAQQKHCGKQPRVRR
jgi:hypothetical protein